MAIQHELLFDTEDRAKVFKENLHLRMQNVVSIIDGTVVTVIDGNDPPQTETIERLARGSTGSFKAIR